MSGRRWYPPPVPDRPPLVLLTARQADVLAGICLGQTNAHIGRRLFITEECVKTHVRRILRAMGARNRCDAAALACSGRLAIHVKDEAS